MRPLVLLGVVAIPILAQPPAPPPTPGGRPLKFWIAELDSTSALHREEALAVLADLGAAAKEALPAVEKLLRDERASVRRQAALALWKLGGDRKPAALALAEDLKNTDWQHRYRVLRQIGELGPDAGPAVPALLAMMAEPEPSRYSSMRAAVATTIKSLGKGAVPALVEAVGHKEATIRGLAATQLGAIGADAKEAASAPLAKALKDTEATVRTRAAWALWQLGERGAAPLRVLVEDFAGAEPEMRQAILAGLIQLDSRPQGIEAVYKVALKEKDPLTQLRAAEGLWEVEKKPDLIVPALIEILHLPLDNQGRDRKAIQLLGKMGPQAKQAIPDLIQRLTYTQGHDLELARTLVAIGEPAVEPLLDLLATPVAQGENDPVRPRPIRPVAPRPRPVPLPVPPQPPIPIQPQPGVQPPIPRPPRPVARTGSVTPRVKVVAAEVLGLIGKPTVEACLKRLDPDDFRRCESACLALAACGAEAKPAVPKLIKVLQDGGTGRRRDAAIALGRIGPDAREASEALLAAVSDADAGVRQAVVEALNVVGGEAKALAAAGEKALKDARPLTRAHAVELLWKGDPKNEQILPEARKLLGQAESRSAILRVLSRMGPDAKEAIPAIVELLTDKDVSVKSEATMILGQLGPVAREASPALVRLLKEIPYGGMPYVILPALQAIGISDAKEAAPVLIAQLRYLDASHPRPHLFTLLAGLGKEAAPAIPDLVRQAQTSFSPQVRAWAAEAVQKLDPEKFSKEVLPALKGDLEKPGRGVYSALALHRVEPDGKDALELLRKTMVDPKAPDGHLAMRTLGLVGAPAKEAIPDLKRRFEETKAAPSRDLAMAYWRISGDASKVVPLLIEELFDNTANQTDETPERLLAELGPAAKDAIPALLLARLRDDIARAHGARLALQRIDPGAALRAGIRWVGPLPGPN